MRELSISKRFKLDTLGEAWENCYIDYKPLNYQAIQAVAGLTEDEQSFDKLMDMLKEQFISGKVVVNDQVVAMEKDDLTALPVDVINQLVKQASGSLAQGSSEK